MFHEGPLLAYLSRSPEQTEEGLQKYQADGDWFKIRQTTPFSETSWFDYKPLNDSGARFSEVGMAFYFTPPTWAKSITGIWLLVKFNFTLPSTTPPGFYLLRAESIYPSGEFNRTQFYMNCAQIEWVINKPMSPAIALTLGRILGPGNPKTDPGPTVKFPGAYDHHDEGESSIPTNFEEILNGAKQWATVQKFWC